MSSSEMKVNTTKPSESIADVNNKPRTVQSAGKRPDVAPLAVERAAASGNTEKPKEFSLNDLKTAYLNGLEQASKVASKSEDYPDLLSILPPEKINLFLNLALNGVIDVKKDLKKS